MKKESTSDMPVIITPLKTAWPNVVRYGALFKFTVTLNISRSLHNKNLSKHQTKISTVHTKSGNEQYPPVNGQ